MNFQKDKKTTIVTPTLLTLPSPVKKIVTGPNHSYAIANQELYHWGAKHETTNHHKLDESGSKSRKQQVGVSQQLTVIPLAVEHLSTNRYHTFAWKGYNVYCWGSNISYELGLEEEKYYEFEHMQVLEKAISQGYELRDISCGQHHTLAVLYRKNEGSEISEQSIDSEVVEKSQDYDDSSPLQLYAWGQSESYQLTINSHNIIPYPVLAPCNFKHLDKVYSQSDYNAALCNEKVYTWGCNIFSRLGQPISSSQLPKVRIPRQVVLPERISKIGVGTYHVVAVGITGAAYAWGKGNQGQLGIHQYETQSKPTKMICDEPISQVSCGQAHTMVLLTDGRLKTCGSNSYAVLGHSEFNPKDKKKRCKKLEFVHGVADIGKIKMICSGNNHNLVLNEQGKVYGWGSNTQGQLLSEQEQLVNDSIVSLSSNVFNSNAKDPAISNSKEPRSFTKDPKYLQITIDIDYMQRSRNRQNNSSLLSNSERLQNWKHRYSAFLAYKQRQQQQFMKELQQITKQMALEEGK